MNRFLHFLYNPPHYDPTALVFFRIGIAALLLTLTITTWEDYLDLYGASGAIQRDISEVFIKPYLVTSYQIVDAMQGMFGGSEMENLLALRWIYLAFILMLGIGLLTRFSAFVTWLLHLAYMQSSHYMAYGVDYVHTFMLFLCIILPVGCALSVDALLFRSRRPNITPYIRLLQLHLCVIYLVGGIGKAMGVNWWNGESIWKSMHRPFTSNTHLPWMADYPIVPIALGIGVVLLELLYPVMIWWKPTRMYWLSGIIMMHLGIAIFLGLPLFSASMIVLDLTAFYFLYAKQPVHRKSPAPVVSERPVSVAGATVVEE